MWHYALSTARSSLRRPSTYIIAGTGLFLGWFGGAYSILALDNPNETMPALFLSSALMCGVFTIAWFVARSLEDDRGSQFRLAADQAAPGSHGRVLGRWAGALLVAILSAGLVFSILSLGLTTKSASLKSTPSISLHNTYSWVRGSGQLMASIILVASCGAWAVFFARWTHPTVALVGGAAAWMASHVPWESVAVLGGAPGSFMRCLFPSATLHAGVLLPMLLGSCAAIAGVLCLALAAPTRS